jgi:hypothetical protein
MAPNSIEEGEFRTPIDLLLPFANIRHLVPKCATEERQHQLRKCDEHDDTTCEDLMAAAQGWRFRSVGSRSRSLLVVCGFYWVTALAADPAWAITAGQVDEFADDDYQNWEGAAAGVLEDVGPAGDGDFALLVQTSGFPSGPGSRLITFSGGSSAPNATQWTGDWTAAGIRAIAFDVLNPNQFELNLWLGIAGPDPPRFAGSGDAYVSKLSIAVPPDDNWQSGEFSVLPEDFDAWGVGSDPAAALASVFQFRIMHATSQEWRGATGEAAVLIDNIRAIAIPEPAALWMMASATVVAVFLQRLRETNRPKMG